MSNFFEEPIHRPQVNGKMTTPKPDALTRPITDPNVAVHAIQEAESRAAAAGTADMLMRQVYIVPADQRLK